MQKLLMVSLIYFPVTELSQPCATVLMGIVFLLLAAPRMSVFILFQTNFC